MDKASIPMVNIQSEFTRLIENGSTAGSKRLRTVLFDAFSQGIQAVMPDQLIENCVYLNGTQLVISSKLTSQRVQYDLLKFSKVLVIGGGKAAAGLANGIISKIGTILPCYGNINIPKGQESIWGESIKFSSENGIQSEIKVVYASHPIPDEEGIRGTKKMIELVSKSDTNTLVIVIISGGGSALMPLPKSPITIAALQTLNEVLLKCGANIVEINNIRKHISDFKGGQLAQVIHPRTAVSLILSDVKGDPLDSIASGPTTYDTGTYANAWEVIEKYRIVHLVPESIRVVLRKGVNGLLRETPKQNDPVFSKMTNIIIGSSSTALTEIKRVLQKMEFKENSIFSAPELFGEAKKVGKTLADMVQSIQFEKLSTKRLYLINTGECTVTLTGKGTGGRNQEMMLAMLQELITKPKVNYHYSIISMALDGIEGNSPAAGAILDSETVAKLKKKELKITKSLSDNDSYSFFKEVGDAIETGQTGTNVNDIYCILIESK